MYKRDESVDFIKGLLIWGVVFGHTLRVLLIGHEGGALLTYIRTYDMPFFMILSGYFFRKSIIRNGTVTVIVNRITMIMIPIIVWTLVRRSINIVGGMYYFLWAVLASGMICACVRKIADVVVTRFRTMLEILMYLGITVILHLINCPWNLFYLFPFFIVGYLFDQLPPCNGEVINIIALFLLVLGLCYWKTSYTPWCMDGLAWRDGGWVVIGIYAYRFILALLGVHIMWRIFLMIYNYFGEESFFVRLMVCVGAETLPLYVLHMLPLRVIQRLMIAVPLDSIGNYNVCVYIVAPSLSLAIITALLFIVRKMKRLPVIKYSLGFRAR